jgi:uncharacterized protein
MLFDSHYLLFVFVPSLLIGLYAQMKLRSTYGKYSQVGLQSGLSGAEAARAILDRAGLTNVPVQEIDGHLSDHYDPVKRTLSLSSENFHGRSVAAVGVAAHETGHALQQQAAYAPLDLRMKLVPLTQFASFAWSGILLIGMILRGVFFTKCLFLAVGIFAVITLFQLVTLPVEFDASRRAKDQLFRLGLVHADEASGVERVLNAAALTYVAALIGSVLQLLYWLTLARGGNRN